MIATLFSSWIGYLIPVVLGIGGLFAGWASAKKSGRQQEQLKNVQQTQANTGMQRDVKNSVDGDSDAAVHERLRAWTRDK